MDIRGHCVEELPPTGQPPCTQDVYGIAIGFPEQERNLEEWTFHSLEEAERNVVAIESSYSEEIDEGAKVVITHWLSGSTYY